MDLRHTVRTTVVGSDSLVRQLTYRIHVRYELATPCDRIGVLRLVRVKTGDTNAVNEDVSQQGITTQLTVVGHYVRVGCTTLGIDDHLLVTVVRIIDDHGLTFAGRYGQLGQRSTLVDSEGIVVLGRCKTGDGCTVQLQVSKRGVVVFLDCERYHVGVNRAIFSGHSNTPFTFCKLTEEDHLCVVVGDITNLGIGATCRQRTSVIQLRCNELGHSDTIDQDRLERLVAQVLAREGNGINRLVAFCIGDVQRSYLTFPEHLNGLARVSYDTCYDRQ